MNIKLTIIMKIKDFLASLFVVISLFLVACNEENPDNRTPDLPTEPIVILYENDVHCAVDGYPLLNDLGGRIGSEYSKPQGRIIFTAQ